MEPRSKPQAIWLQQSHWNRKHLSINGTQMGRCSRTWKLENQSNILASQRMDAAILALWGKTENPELSGWPPFWVHILGLQLKIWGNGTRLYEVESHATSKYWGFFSFHLFHICWRDNLSGLIEALSTATKGTWTLNHLEIWEENGKAVLCNVQAIKENRINQSERQWLPYDSSLIHFLVKLEICRARTL